MTQMDTIQMLYNKFNANRIKSNPKQFTPVACSMGNYDLQKCQPYKMSQQKKSFMYLDQWFHREILDYENLPNELQELLQMNWRFMFYPKGVYTSLKDRLIKPSFYFNSFNSTLMSVTPSRLQNYGKSEYQDCIPGNHLLNFDPRCRGWYKLAMQNEGITFFNPYLQISSFTIGITISQRFDNAAGDNLSVFSFNLDITNLVDRVFQSQDRIEKDSHSEGYTVFFHSDNQTVFHHRAWNRKYGILNTWEEVEYNRTLYSFQDGQHSDFKQNLQNIMDYSKKNMNQQIEFNEYEDSNFIYFEKEDKKYLGLVYPLEVKSKINAYRSNQMKVQRPFFIGRVHSDIRNIIEEANFFFFNIFKNLCFVEVAFILIVLIISLLHYSAVLVHTIDIPLDFLTQFLKQFDLSENFKSQQNQIIKNAINKKMKKIPLDETMRQQDFMETVETNVENALNYPMQLLNKLSSNNMTKSSPKKQISSYQQVTSSFQLQKSGQLSPKKRLKNSTLIPNLNKQGSKGSTIDTPQVISLETFGNDNCKNPNNFNGFSKSSYFKQMGLPKVDSQKLIAQPKRNRTQSKTLKSISSKSKIEDQSSSMYNDMEQGRGYNCQSVHQNLLNHMSMNNQLPDQQSNKSNVSKGEQVNNNLINKKYELKDMDSMFKEMQIIKETFLQLEKVILLAQQDSCQGNIESSIINFCIAKSIFMKIKNHAQVSNCNYNIGILYIRKRDFQKAGEVLEASIYNHFQSEGNGITCIKEYLLKLKSGELQITQSDIDSIVFLAQKIKAFVVSLRQQGIQPNIPKQDQQNMLQKGIEYSRLCIEMLQTLFRTYSHPSLLTSYITQASIYIDLDLIEQAVQSMINADIIWEMYFEENKDNENNLFSSSFVSSNKNTHANIQSPIGNINFSSNEINHNSKKFTDEIKQQTFKYSIIPVNIIKANKLMHQGRIYLKLNLLKQGCNLLTEAVEHGEIFDPFTRMEALMNLNRALQSQKLDNSYILEEIQKFSGDPLNIFIILSCPVTPQNIGYISFQIQFIQKLYQTFIKVSDRISIIQFHNEVVNINQLCHIQSETHLSNFLQRIHINFINQCNEYQQEPQPMLHWTVALRQILLKIIYGQNISRQISFYNKFKQTIKNQQDYPIEDIDLNVNNENQQLEYFMTLSKLSSPIISGSSFDQQSSQYPQQQQQQLSNQNIQTNKKQDLLSDIKLMQSPYKNRKDLIIMISQDEFNNTQNGGYMQHVDPFEGLNQAQIPPIIHLKKSVEPVQIEQNNQVYSEFNQVNIELSSLASNGYTTINQKVSNKKYNQHFDFNQFFKEILSERIQLKEEK